ncbi:MAG TPA: hypothetical protein VI583_17435 [Cyclobacteriaceae bacterium]|nr:hypothetical protein [Cyclobacteriaceae bacterium]
MFIRYILGVILISLQPETAKLQDIGIHSGFLADTIRIGEQSAFRLSVLYPDRFRLILPDSTFNYGEFELVRRDWFPTERKGDFAYDSVIYYLTTFEIDSFIGLTLPVYILQGSDCLRYNTIPDSMALKQVIPVASDTLKLRSDTNILRVPKAFNYPLFLFASGFVLLSAGLIIAVFGKKIARRFRIYRMRRRHRNFVRRFYERLGLISENNGVTDPEHVLLDWKKYMEALEKEPYTKLTTQELMKIYRDSELTDNLKAIDRFIYGSIKDKPLHLYFSNLLDYSVRRFQVRIKEVQDGI